MADTETLGVVISLDDKGFTDGIKKAKNSTDGLSQATKALVPGLSAVEKSMGTASGAAQGITNKIKEASGILDKFKRSARDAIVKIRAKDDASPTVKKIKDELNKFKGKVYTATVNVKQNLSGVAGKAADTVSGAMFGATAQMAGMAGIGFGVFDAVKGYADFEEEMSAVKAISGATGDEFNRLKEKAIQMGADTKYSALESAQAFRYMGMAGWKTGEMIDGIAGIMNLAAASGEDLAMTADIVTDSLSAFGLQAKDSSMFADVLAAAATNSNTNVALMGQTFKYAAPVAGALGFTVQDTATAIGLMANQGIKGSEAGTALRSTMTRMVKPTNDSAEAMQILGLNILDANGKMKPFRDIIKDVRSGMSKLTPESKASVAAMLAGQEAMSGLLALVNSSDADFDKLASAIDNSNGAAQNMASIRMDNLKGDLEQLSGDWDSFTTKIMGGGIGGFREIVQGIDNWFAGFAENVETNGLNVKSIIDGITSAVKELVEQTVKMEGLPSILSGIALAVAGVGAFKFGKKIKNLFKKGKGSSSGGGDETVGEMTVNALQVTLNAAKLLPGVGEGNLPGLPGGRDSGGNRPSNYPPNTTTNYPPKHPSNTPSTPVGDKGRKYGRKAWDTTKSVVRKSWDMTRTLGGKSRDVIKIVGSKSLGIAKSTAQKSWGITNEIRKGIGEVSAKSFKGISKGMGVLGQGLMKVGGKAAIPLSLAMGAYDIATSDDKGKAASGMAGSLAGGLAGAKLGAMGGAALGSVIPGIGTAVGGALGGLVGGIGGAIFGEELGQSIYEGITSNLEGIKQWFSDTWNSIVSACTPIINTIVGIVATAYDGIISICSPLSNWFSSTVWQPISNFAQSTTDTITSAFDGACSAVKGAWSGIVDWFNENVWSPLKQFGQDALSTIGNGINSAMAKGSSITGLKLSGHATGSNYFGGGWTEINERGGEIVDLPSGSRIYPHATTEKMLAEQFGGTISGGNNYSISGNTFVVREEADIDRIAHSLFSMIASAESNYGGV